MGCSLAALMQKFPVGFNIIAISRMGTRWFACNPEALALCYHLLRCAARHMQKRRCLWHVLIEAPWAGRCASSCGGSPRTWRRPRTPA